MLEIPESRTVGTQANDFLAGKTIVEVINATSPHKFAWFYDDPLLYPQLLNGKQIQSAAGHGMFVDVLMDDNIRLSIGDGTIIRYYESYEKRPDKHQLLINFDDGSFLAFTVAMYGAIYAYKGELDNIYHKGSLNSVSPLEDEFNEQFFENIIRKVTKDVSVKALLATEQRIPGLGNGVLQDILFNTGIHPKRKKSTLSDFEKGELFHHLKFTLRDMTDKGGRDTEKDLFGNAGKYKTLLSKNTYKDPCPNCGDTIIKEAYLGGSIYYCSTCQH
ncbi:endonuclease VIII [Paludibacteraceae bacterium OttesenSCG-928-F17]|nr:endonuclease VIII [Paludibacteraceae bacterium OttesenSCG-928-F17]